MNMSWPTAATPGSSWGELRSGGALRFYEDTEEIVRAGKFERAYLRLVFLRAHIQGLPLEAGPGPHGGPAPASS